MASDQEESPSFNHRSAAIFSDISDDTDVDAEDFPGADKPVLGPPRRFNKTYIPIQERFKTTEAAKLYMRKSNYKCKVAKPCKKKGYRINFSCLRFNSCPRTGYILLNNGSDGHVNCSIFFADIDHDHTKPITKTNDLKDVKPFIKELINMNRKISNERILHALASAKLPQVSQQQLNNLKSRLKNTNPKTSLACFFFS
jgi:hypothetical protein